jgi:purine-binding chemotaxis protein CheW
MGEEILSQYLTFALQEEKYAVSVTNVREVLELVPVTKIPGMPPFMKGVLNLRGSVVPVIDLRKKFSLPESSGTVDTSIIILEIKTADGIMLVGALVDSVKEVIHIDADQIESAPSIGLNVDSDYILGMFQYNNDFLIILNINNVLKSGDIVKIPAAAKNAEGVSKSDEKK